MFAQCESHAADDFFEQLFGLRRVARPDPRMELNSGGRGENGGLGVGIHFIQRADALLDFGFGQSGDAQVAGIESLAASVARETSADFGFEEAFELGGRAGKQDDDVAFGFDPQAGSGAARIGKHDGALRDHGLARVDFRHGAGEAAEAFLNAAQNFFV